MNKDYILNENIKSEFIYLVNPEDNKLEKTELKLAIEKARDEIMNVVQVGLYNALPLCKIKDTAAESYYQKKNQKKSLQVISKRVVVTPNIDNHDLIRKIDVIRDFLSKHFTVSIQIRYKRGFRKKFNKDEDIQSRFVKHGIMLIDTKSKNIFNISLKNAEFSNNIEEKSESDEK